MNYDESNASLTNELCGRTIERLDRVGKEIHIVCTDGHIVVIQSDVNGDIHYKKTSVSIMMPRINVHGIMGKM